MFYVAAQKSNQRIYEKMTEFSRKQLINEDINAEDISEMTNFNPYLVFIPSVKIDDNKKQTKEFVSLLDLSLQIMNVNLFLRNVFKKDDLISPVFMVTSTNLIFGNHSYCGFHEFFSQFLSKRIYNFFNECDPLILLNEKFSEDKLTFLGVKNSDNSSGILVTNPEKLSLYAVNIGTFFWVNKKLFSFIGNGMFHESNIDLNLMLFIADFLIVNYFYSKSSKNGNNFNFAIKMDTLINKMFKKIRLKPLFYVAIDQEMKIYCILRLGFLRITLIYDQKNNTFNLKIAAIVVMDIKETLNKESLILS